MCEIKKLDKNLIELDIHSKTGSFTVHSERNIDMLELRKYCKSNKINYSDLTNKEIKKFKK